MSAGVDPRNETVHEGTIMDGHHGDDTLTRLPCRHGSTCRLHDQVILSPAIPNRRPEDLDNGEMTAMVEAARRAAELLDGYHERLRGLRESVTHSYVHAGESLDRLATLATSKVLVSARRDQQTTRQRLSKLAPDQLRRPSRASRIAGYAVVAGIAVFETVFFYQSLVDVLALPAGSSAIVTAPNAIPGMVLALGLVIAGGVLSGPFWRLSKALRDRGTKPSSVLAGSLRTLGRAGVVLAFPVALFSVLGLWASIRGQMAFDTTFLPPDWTVVALLLSLSLIAVTIEVRLGNPFAQEWHEADVRVRSAQTRLDEARREASGRLGDHELLWRDLRSARDEMLALVRVELCRPWEELILPSRLRHGRAGALPPVVARAPWAAAREQQNSGTTPSGPGPATPVPWRNPLAHTSDEGLTMFAEVDQPMPALGPLAEVVRQIEEFHPRELRERLTKLTASLDQEHVALVDDVLDLRQSPDASNPAHRPSNVPADMTQGNPKTG